MDRRVEFNPFQIMPRKLDANKHIEVGLRG